MADKKPYIIIKKFKKHQHYQDSSRPIAWIKLWLKLLRDDDFLPLTNAERWIYIGLVMLASLKKNKIFYEKRQILSFICDYKTNEKTLENAIDSLKKNNLIDIKMLSKRYQSATLDKDKDKDIRLRRRKEFFSSIKNYFTNSYKEQFSIRNEKDEIIEERLPAINFGKDNIIVEKARGLFTLDEAYKLIDNFLQSEKADRCGFTLSICFSTDTINLFRAGKLHKSASILEEERKKASEEVAKKKRETEIATEKKRKAEEIERNKPENRAKTKEQTEKIREMLKGKSVLKKI